jgi:hypothetical protein
LRGRHFDIREAAVIVDRDMDVLPANATGTSAPIAVDAMPDAVDLSP